VLFYLTHHSSVSGIQRVVVEVVPHLQVERSCLFVAYSVARGRFVVPDQVACQELLHCVQSADDSGRTSVQAMAAELYESLGNAPDLVAAQGDVLAALGATWNLPGYFRAVRAVKSLGTAMVLLMYDLIPVVLPGFPERVMGQFRWFLPRVAGLADRVPAISRATRDDFERYCLERGWQCPPGGVTRLAADQWRADRMAVMNVDPAPAWPRPFVLMVATIEVRKNHLLALRAWQRLLQRLEPDAVPDLVCVGRMGWNAFEFLEQYAITEGLGGRIHLLTDSVSDARLAALYRDCLFTVYPSRYEGWGLPIAESLDMGKPVVSTSNSSLREVGEGFATYVDDNDLDGFTDAIAHYLTDPQALARDAERIRTGYSQPSWRDVAQVLLHEIDEAARARRPVDDSIGLEVEYGMADLAPYTGGHDGQEYLDFLTHQRALPLTGQIDHVERGLATELIADPPTDPDRGVRIRITRPVEHDLFLVIATTEGPGVGEIHMVGPPGRQLHRIVRGEAIAAPLGTGQSGTTTTVTVTPLSGWHDQPVVRSFILVDSQTRADELVTRTLARLASTLHDHPHPDPTAAQQLAQVLSSRSWRLTKPLRHTTQLLKRRKKISDLVRRSSGSIRHEVRR
jgi:glycosyltransferase involved in cell wall biosynthesis